MLTGLALSALAFAAAGCAGGIYLACRYAWPRRIYGAIFAARP